MNIDYVKKVCQATDRLELVLRTDKTLATAFLDIMTQNNIVYINPYIPMLASWCNYSIDNIIPGQEYSRILSIEYNGLETTYDLEIPNGNSYVANGIICHNTHNIPNSSTLDDIGQIYMLAWKLGCKGATIYRDGSRDAILTSIDNKKDDRLVPKRPRSLGCDIHHVTVKGNNWIVIVGLNENVSGTKIIPYEIFAFKKKHINISPKVTKGILTRIKSGCYNLEINDIMLENVTDLFEKDEEEALTRIISLTLRHNQVPIEFIVDQLNKSEGSIISFSKAIARTLKKYITDDERIIKKDKCPICNGVDFQYTEGCLKCKECGWSKC